MLIWTLLSALWMILGHRIGFIFFKMRLTSEVLGKKIHLLFLFFLITLNFLCQKSATIHCLLLLLLIFVPFVALFIIHRAHSTQFINLRVSILDSLIVRMRSGTSLRMALQEQSDFLPNWFVPQWIKFFERSGFQKNTSLAPEAKFFNELSSVEDQKYKQIEKLKALRERYNTKLKFRQKSRRAMYQVRIQGLVLSLFFIGICVFQIIQNNFFTNINLMLVALSLFSLGTIWLLNIGRKYTWKI